MRIALDLARRAVAHDLREPGWILGRSALAGLLLLALLGAFASSGQVGAAGLRSFSALVALDFGFVTALAVGPFASALTEERRGDTLGVLRLAGLSPAAVLTAKAAGLLGSSILLLLVQVPFALLATTLGGVTRFQVAAAFVHLFTYLLAAQGFALWAAARLDNPRTASFLTGAVLATWLLAPTAIAAASAAFGASGAPRSALAQSLAAGSPLQAALPRFDLPAPELLTAAVWLCLSIAVVCYVCAAHALGRLGVAIVAEPRDCPRLSKERRGRIVARRPGRRSAALRWKEEHYLVGGPLAVRRRLIAYGVLWLVLGLVTYDRRGDWLSAWGSVGLFAFTTIALLEAGWISSLLFREEIRERTLFALALLPLPPMTWAVAKASGVFLALRVPAVFAAASYALLVAAYPSVLGVAPFAIGVWVLIGLLVVYVTLFLSLWLSRGAFLVAIAAIGGPVSLLVTFPTQLLASLGCCSFYVLPVAILSVVSALQVAMGRRLRTLAAQ